MEFLDNNCNMIRMRYFYDNLRLDENVAVHHLGYFSNSYPQS